MNEATKTSVKASFCHMSSAVPAVCPTTAPLSVTSSLSVYKGAKAMAETISVFTQKRRFFSVAANNCFLPI